MHLNNDKEIVKIEQSRARLSELLKQKYPERKPVCYLHSYGCQQNVSDGEKLKGMLSEAGYDFCDTAENADLIILNTCAVRENAEDKIYGIIGEYKHLKNNNPELIIGICGCMAQESKTAERIKSTYKQVELVFGTFAYKQLFDMLYEVISNRRLVINQSEDDGNIIEGLSAVRTSSFSASVSVMYGCNNFCSYCIVPYVRGRERSRTPDAVYDEVSGLIKSGYKEIMLLGQNVNSYSYGFPQLLRKLNSIDGDFIIRFMSSHPKDASHELIDAIVECEKVAKCLHLPVQCGCNRILKEMNRRYTVEDYLEIVSYARSRITDFSFSTDIIVGFPGETYDEFCQTKELIKNVGYDNIFSFVYSKRSGTKAALMQDNISEKQKGLWLRELLMEQRETSQKLLSRFVGKTVRVLIDSDVSGKEGYVCGKNSEGIIVELMGSSELIGSFAQVKVIKAMNWALLGEIVI